ncbi:MAG: DUF2752 domain-containing protein [Oscillospiraceae bacterium]|nr:DUF2752 domain-containing protein [Oscillospiraceae bacterium]
MQHNSISKKRRAAAVLLCILPFAAYGLLILAKLCYARWLEPKIPPCVLRSFTGYRCPGCGMTHSFYAVSRLDLITAMRENAVLPVLLLFAALYYAELWLRVLGRPRRLISRRHGFVYAMLALWAVYCVARNFY